MRQFYWGGTPPRPPSGTVFPSSPVTGDIFYRSDRMIEYSWDGTRWLSTQLFVLSVGNKAALLPLTASADFHEANPMAGLYDIYVTRGVISSLPTAATPASNFFSSQFQTIDGSTAANIGAAMSQVSAALNVWTTQAVVINAVVASTIEALNLANTETGIASTSIVGCLHYRLVG